jgi:hypothetical protein
MLLLVQVRNYTLLLYQIYLVVGCKIIGRTKRSLGIIVAQNLLYINLLILLLLSRI